MLELLLLKNPTISRYYIYHDDNIGLDLNKKIKKKY